MKKQRQSKVVGVELRAGGGLHRPEKPGWSAGDMEKQPGNEVKNNKMKIKNEMTLKNDNEQQQQQKPSQGVLPSKVPLVGVFDFSI